MEKLAQRNIENDFMKEVKVDENGVRYISRKAFKRLTGAKIVGCTFNNIVTEFLESQGVKDPFVPINDPCSNFGIRENVAKLVVGYYAIKGLNPTVKRQESIVARAIHKESKGRKEVQAGRCRIDILTKTEIVEVKRDHCWKSAIGQLLYYQTFYPDKSMRLHLFGANAEKYAKEAQSICKKLEITVTYSHEQ